MLIVSEKWKYRSNTEREETSLVDVYAMIEGWKRPFWMGGFHSFNDAGEFMLDCIADDKTQGFTKPVTYSVKINLPVLNPVHVKHYDKYGDSVLLWMRVPGTLTDDEAINMWNGLGYDDEATWCQHEHDCCGHVYHGSLRIKNNGHSTLLSQSYGRNV